MPHSDKPTLACDWDGTVVEDAWPEWGKFLPGAVKSLKKLSKKYDIVIHTCRISTIDQDGKRRSRQDVLEEVLHLRHLLDSSGLGNVRIHTNQNKPSADVYLDNKGLRFEGNWSETTKVLEGMLNAESKG